MNINQKRPAIPRRAESGQAIVLIAMVMIALIGMLGLAVDGGGLYFMRRDAQNATDAAVLAATYARCTLTHLSGTALQDAVELAGYQGAAANGFVNNTSTAVTVHNPPITGTGVGNDDYIEVRITSAKPSYFIHLVYGGPLEIQTYAVGNCARGREIGNFGAMFGISETCQNTVEWSTSSATIVGDLFSNNELKSAGGGGGNVIVGAGETAGQYQVSNGGNTSWCTDTTCATSAPEPTEGVPVRDDPLQLEIADYAPGGMVAQEAALAGLYTHVTSSHPWIQGGKFKPAGEQLEGLYFIDDGIPVQLGDFTVTDLNGNGVVDGITIVSQDDIASNGSMTIPLNHYIDGLLFFTDHTPSGSCSDAISFSASGVQWEGLIYAPNGGISASFSNGNGRGALIAQTVDISGSNFVYDYVPDLIKPRAPVIAVAE